MATNFNDTVVGSSASEQLLGLGGNDVIFGGGGADTLIGGQGADELSGGTQSNNEDNTADLLQGNDGSDILNGGHNDTLQGGAGADLLFANSTNVLMDGGSGADDYRFQALVKSHVTAIAGTATDTGTDNDFYDMNMLEGVTTLAATVIDSGGSNDSLAIELNEDLSKFRLSELTLQRSNNNLLIHDINAPGLVVDIVNFFGAGKIESLFVNLGPNDTNAVSFSVPSLQPGQTGTAQAVSSRSASLAGPRTSGVSLLSGQVQNLVNAMAGFSAASDAAAATAVHDTQPATTPLAVGA